MTFKKSQGDHFKKMNHLTLYVILIKVIGNQQKFPYLNKMNNKLNKIMKLN